MITVKDSVLEQEIEDKKTAEYEKWKQEVLFRPAGHAKKQAKTTVRTALPPSKWRTVVPSEPAIEHTRNEILEDIIFSQATEDLMTERSNEKPNLSCLVTTFTLALEAISKVHDYDRGPLVKDDYMPSLLRHLFKIGEHPDHDAALAWNALAWLEIKLRKNEKEMS